MLKFELYFDNNVVLVQRTNLKRILRQESFQKLASFNCLLHFRILNTPSHPHIDRMYLMFYSDSWDKYRLALYQPVLIF